MGKIKGAIIILLYSLFIGIPAFSQNPYQCHYPIHVSADSLLNIIIHDICYPCKNCKYVPCQSCEDWKKDFDDKLNGIKIDSALWKCQDYLIEHLGSSVYCNYINMYLNSFTGRPNRWRLSFGFQLPNLKLKNRQMIGTLYSEYEYVNFEFVLTLLKDSSIIITYPDNVPNCNGLLDCGFVYTKEKAIELAKNIGFLNDSSRYYIKPDGINWQIDIAEDKHGQTKTIKINIQTGEQSEIKYGQRID
jgi:hypothetical protein